MKLAWTDERRERAREYKFINRGKNAARLMGENNPNAKLTQLQINEIVKLCRSKKYFYYEIAQMFNVSKDTIYRINKNINGSVRNWNKGQTTETDERVKRQGECVKIFRNK